jgi:Na+/melibiose symporter-like transporter
LPELTILLIFVIIPLETARNGTFRGRTPKKDVGGLWVIRMAVILLPAVCVIVFMISTAHAELRTKGGSLKDPWSDRLLVV